MLHLAGICALCEVFYALLLCHRAKISMWSAVGSPTWDFSRSWASNITITTGFFSVVLSVGLLPAKTSLIPRSDLVFSAVLFSGLIFFAPALFAFTSKPYQSVAGGFSYRGTLAMFMLCGAVTATGVFGQSFALLVLLQELKSVVDPLAATLLQGVIVTVIFALAAYLPKGLYLVAFNSTTEATAKSVPRDIKPWSLL